MTTQWTRRFDELHERASAKMGLADFGDDLYYEGLHKLLEALEDNLDPRHSRPVAAEMLIVDQLAARLQTEEQWQINPAYRQRPISAPLVVIGVPRTGTTALHGLLSQDREFQGFEKWLMGAPMVRPPRAKWEQIPQYQAMTEAVRQRSIRAPELMKAHGVRADDCDECILPMAQNFCSNLFTSWLDIPLYDRWLLGANETPSYRRYKDVLRLVGLNDDRRWLLKNPSHVFGIDALLAAFPDACIIQTHRDPIASLASVTSLLQKLVEAHSGEPIDRQRRLARETAFWSEAVKRTMAAQERHPDRFVNVRQQDIRRDPLGVVRRIYERFGLELSAEAERAMEGWAARNAERPGEVHEYDQVEDKQPIREAFAPYMARFGF